MPLMHLFFIAWIYLVRCGVVGLFFPAMAMVTIFHFLASFRVLRYISGRLPILTFCTSVAEKFRISSKILPIVSIYTVGFMMVLPEGAPLRLKMVYVEVRVLRNVYGSTRF